MSQSGSRRGAANMAPILMILSFAAMAGLLWWLNSTAVGTEPVAVDEEAEVDSVEAGATLVTREQLQTGAATMVGQMVRLEDVPVASRVGSNAFMIELGDPERSSPFLVVLDSALVSGGRGIPQGTATVAGTVRERTDSLVDVWVEDGIVPAGQRIVVEFSSHFIDATRLRGPGQRPGSGGQGQGEGTGGGTG